MAYRVHNHALDLAFPTTSDALMISVDSQQVPSYTQIPRQISIDELKMILPGSWVTNYEKLFQPYVAVQFAEFSFKTRKDGLVEFTFNKPEEETSPFTI